MMTYTYWTSKMVCVSRGVREYRRNIPYAEHIPDHNDMNVK